VNRQNLPQVSRRGGPAPDSGARRGGYSGHDHRVASEPGANASLLTVGEPASSRRPVSYARHGEPASYRAGVDLFSTSWTALRAAVAELPDHAFAQLSGCTGWLVQDLVSHLIIDAQDVLITLVTPTETAPTRDAYTYWEVTRTPPTGHDPLDALIVRLAAAYEQPRLLKFHLDDVGSAAGRAAHLADPQLRICTRGEVLTVADYLNAYVLEWTLHHLDLTAHLADVPGPPAEGLRRSREMLEMIARATFPSSFSDTDALLIGTGRRDPTCAEQAKLGELAAKLPLVLR
jgi:Mycothiol maleylpyruvate isomerase N-terminal domain